MRDMPFNLQGNGVVEVAEISSRGKWKKESSCLGCEPTSVLDMIRSPSPPTSTSTLSSSFGGGGGGGGSTDVSGVAAVSDKLQSRSAAAIEPGGGGGGGVRKDEWGSELQSIPTTFEIVNGVGKCGLGAEDWESILSESASPSQEQSFIRWIMGDLEDPSSGLKQLLQSGGSSEIGGNGGFGIVDQGFGFETIGGGDSGSISPSLTVPGSGFPPININNNNSCSNGRIGSVQNQSPNPIFSPSQNNLPLPIPSPPGVFYQQQFEASDEKPQLFNPQMLINQNQTQNPQNHPSFFVPLSYAQQEQHRHSSSVVDPSFQIPKIPLVDSGQELFLRRQQQQQNQPPQGFPHQLHLLPNHLHHQRPMMMTKPKMVATGDEMDQLQQQSLVDELFKAAELVETGNLVHARGILARLNHQLSPIGKPLQRAAFYFKEALQLLLMNTPQRNSSPFDVIFKIGAYKAFSEISPILQFANFTCNQAILEALDGFDRIHIIDFDIGLGGQWASFMQELAMRIGGTPSLKITAFASSSSLDPFELGLMRDNLNHFANDIGIRFELHIVSLDSFDPASCSLPLHVLESEAVAVNLPVGSLNHPSSFPSLLRFLKQFSPKIVVSVDRGRDRSDLPFSHHFLHALHSYSILLDSLDAVNLNPDAMLKIERFLLQPNIESTVLGRRRAPEKIPPWRNLFMAAGFSPLTFSNFTETQADCLLKKTPVRGFHVGKREASLVLCWQRQELVSASAWRC
ncbi:hypothetical protein HHK36_028677 [Tetracentron sinense]|uniref:Scarecrow-like protein 6 n=1 Tax=Tetracentron sinense TaxID=13715 RepID=A0A834YHT8_TETSI|nr:hypothetical protein HHK36_028677 [Tetracentron sinense]